MATCDAETMIVIDIDDPIANVQRCIRAQPNTGSWLRSQLPSGRIIRRYSMHLFAIRRVSEPISALNAMMTVEVDNVTAVVASE